MATRAQSVEASTSNHMALWVKVNPTLHGRKPRRFRFENMWLKEDECRTMVANSWRAGTHLSFRERIAFCGEELLRWDSRRTKGFVIKSKGVRRDWHGFKEGMIRTVWLNLCDSKQ
ncbi:unnamed protein product [Cuscuta europaea]|uniref:Uncharacterized protein n=1 Tax=Cuscuta europaea TaxID=41803 RepID=A0A9P1EGH8_CUSEU|nr:unnamed protein product [Cuscuta europaea]